MQDVALDLRIMVIHLADPARRALSCMAAKTELSVSYNVNFHSYGGFFMFIEICFFISHMVKTEALIMTASTSRRSFTADWETYMRRQEEKRKEEEERERREGNERIRAQTRDLPYRDFRIQLEQERLARRGSHGAESAHELQAGHQTYSFGTPEPLPTPPPSIHSLSLDDTIQDLQRQINHQGAEIRSLESKLKSEGLKVRELRSQRHAAVAAQREAILASRDAEIERLKKQISGLSELLDQSEEREKELGQQVDEGQARERELRKQLQDVRAELQSSVAIQLADEANPAALANERDNGGLQRRDTAELGDRQSQEMAAATSTGTSHRADPAQELAGHSMTGRISSSVSGRSRKHSRQMSENGFASFPKASGKRGLYIFG